MMVHLLKLLVSYLVLLAFGPLLVAPTLASASESSSLRGGGNLVEECAAGYYKNERGICVEDMATVGPTSIPLLQLGGSHHGEHRSQKKHNREHSATSSSHCTSPTMLTGSRDGSNDGADVSAKKTAEGVLMYSLETARAAFVEHGFLGEIQVSTSICLVGISWTNVASTELEKIEKAPKRDSKKKKGSSTMNSAMQTTVDNMIVSVLIDLAERALAWTDSDILGDTSLASVTNLSLGFVNLELTCKVNTLEKLIQWYDNDAEKQKSD